MFLTEMMDHLGLQLITDLVTFYSVGAAWNITSEDFLADSSIVNNLKLRASYGESGNNSVGLFSYKSLFSYGGSYNDNGTVTPSVFQTLLSLGKHQN